jgi:hypothetical protein
MTWWIYKCRSKPREHQRTWGDWHELFNGETDDQWGNSLDVPALAQLKRDDMIIAYQTDRNELVGLAKVRQPCGQDTYLYLTPIETIKVKVRPLKKADSRIATIPALQPGIIKTIYEISEADAWRLLRAAGAAFTSEVSSSDQEIDDEKKFIEGERRAVTSTARNPQLRAAAKKKWGLDCYCCGFSFQRFYGSLGKGFAIVHHLQLFEATNGRKRKATVEDVRVVCANCHDILHRENPPIDVEVLKQLISESWTPWSEKGVSRRK